MWDFRPPQSPLRSHLPGMLGRAVCRREVGQARKRRESRHTPPASSPRARGAGQCRLLSPRSQWVAGVEKAQLSARRVRVPSGHRGRGPEGRRPRRP